MTPKQPVSESPRAVTKKLETPKLDLSATDDPIFDYSELANTPPPSFKALLRTPENLVLRLNKLFASSEDFSAIISTLYYLVRLRDRFNTNIVGRLAEFYKTASYKLPYELELVSQPVSKSARLLWNVRMTLRLFRLFPIYARSRQLLTDPKSRDDRVMFTTSLLQCSLYGVSQLLENVAFLRQQGVISGRWMSSLPGASQGGSRTIYTLAYRAWFLGVTCDILRTLRKVQLLWQKTVEDKDKAKAKDGQQQIEAATQTWWHFQFLLPVTWLSVAWQLSARTEDGVPGFNTNLYNLACMCADVEKTCALWRSAAVTA